jgi:hypothetical protein
VRVYREARKHYHLRNATAERISTYINWKQVTSFKITIRSDRCLLYVEIISREYHGEAIRASPSGFR